MLIASEDPAFRRLASEALPNPITFCSRRPAEILEAVKGADLAILEFGALISTGLPLFEQVRAAEPRAAIVLALTGLESWMAVEVIKCGAADVVFLPTTADILAKKVRRTIEGGHWAVVPLPGMLAAEPRPVDDRRVAFRVTLASGSARVLVPSISGRLWTLPVVDLSLPQDRRPGGLAVRLENEMAAVAPFSSWAPGHTPQVALAIDDGHGSLPLTVRIARLTRAADGATRVGLQYTLLTTQDERRVRQLWMASQRARCPR